MPRHALPHAEATLGGIAKVLAYGHAGPLDATTCEMLSARSKHCGHGECPLAQQPVRSARDSVLFMEDIRDSEISSGICHWR